MHLTRLFFLNAITAAAATASIVLTPFAAAVGQEATLLDLDDNEVTVALALGTMPNVNTGMYQSAPSFRSGDEAYWRQTGRNDGQFGTGAWMRAVTNPNDAYESGVTINPADRRRPMVVKVGAKLYYRWVEYLPTPEKRRESQAYWQALIEARKPQLPHIQVKLLPLGGKDICTVYGCVARVTYD